MSVSVFESFLSLFFPDRCIACNRPLKRHETFLCDSCLADLPKTHIVSPNDNIIVKSFWGRIPVQFAYSFLHYTKHSVVQRILFTIKYFGAADFAVFMGELFGQHLKSINFPENFDFFLPIPLHPRKKKIRGYNQAEEIARGLSNILKIPVLKNAVVRTVFTQTQTHLSAHERWQNVQGIFKVVNAKTLKDKHIIIIDDVLTTGATIESLCETLLSQLNVQISILTLATAKGI